MTERRKSIILVTVDCLRADHVGFMGYQRPTTPFLDGLVEKSLVFPTAIVAGTPTYYSFPAIHASRYPLGLGRDVVGLAPEEPTIASVLHEAGYATASFCAANPYISARFEYDNGFEVFKDFLQDSLSPLIDTNSEKVSGKRPHWLNRQMQKMRPALGPLGRVYDELYFRYCQRVDPKPESLDRLRRFPSADVIMGEALRWLGSIGTRPFFLWLHLMDPHSPYYPKSEALELMGDDPITPYEARYLNSYWNRSDLEPRQFAHRCNEVIALYDAGIRWVDCQMKGLVEALRSAGRWDDCILAFTGDHGEEFLDHGGRYHPPSRPMEELIHVPLLLRDPATEKRGVSQGPFSLIHLGPTLLEMVDLAAPESFHGRSHFKDVRSGIEFSDAAISECICDCTNPFHAENRAGSRVLSVRESRFKLICYFDPPYEHLYDLEADPKEHAPLPSDAEKAVRRRLLEVVRDHLHSCASKRDNTLRLKARLRDIRLEWEAHKPLPVNS